MTKSGKHCYYVFNKPSAAEASESVYMLESVLVILKTFVVYTLNNPLNETILLGTHNIGF